MKVRGAAAASAAVILLSGAGGAYAADLDTYTKAPVLKAPAGPATCTGVADFFLTSCQLAWYGVRFYGTIDAGYGYQTHGSPFNSRYGTGVDYMLGKSSRGGMGLLSPNGLSQSNIGLQIKEPLGQGWSFVAQLEAGFDPYSLNASNGPGAMYGQLHVPLALQSSNGDSSRAGQFYNSVGFFGFSNDTYGTLTFFRQNLLTTDAIASYDPMGGSYAFSPIGYSGVTSGGGYTEDARETSAIKYRVNIGNFRLGAFGQFGGYELNNASKGTFQGQVGADFQVGPGILSLDAIGGYTKDAVSLSLSGPTDKFGNPTNIFTGSETLGATISDNTNVMALAKYTVDKLKLYAGYEWIQFANPSDSVSSFTDISGDQICANTGAGSCGALASTSINNAAFAKDKILQVVWTGARYSLTDSVDLAAAYYHYDQNNYNTGTTCSVNGNKSASSCAGTMDAVSFMVDWKFAPKWDTYIGTMYSQMNGGLDNGYLQKSNWATTGGVRFRW